MEMGSSSYSPANAKLTASSHLYITSQPSILTHVPCSSSKPNSFAGDLSVQPDFCTVVPANNAETHLTDSVDLPKETRQSGQRSSEMVRVIDLKPDDHRYYRDQIRRTRMIYESLRVFFIAEDEKNHNMLSPQKSTGWDVKAATIMKQGGLWLNLDKRIVGNIPGVLVGDIFFSRMEMCINGLHGQPKARIDFVPTSQSSNGEPIATSIIVSEGYEDDEDAGDVIIYTGNGGKDKSNRQIMHQKLECGNLAMEKSMLYGVELRVIRRFKYQGSISGKVYVYDGLYRITDTWFDVGKSGFRVYKFKVVRIENQMEMGSAVFKSAMNQRVWQSEVLPKGYVTLDLSNKKENVPVLLFNDIDGVHEPLDYKYLTKAVFPPNAYEYENGTGCKCTGGCSMDCFCIEKNGGEFAYDMNGILVSGKPLIIECGPNCNCPPTCRNRVTQNGIRNQFEVFRSRETGWGVRSLDLIRAGSFICEFAGVVLTREQAQVFTMNGDRLVYPSRFVQRWEEWGGITQIFPHYVRPTHPSIPPLDFAMDVSELRNVACYMSHSSTPNVFVQPVLYDHKNVSFPRLMLFSMENIPPMRELSLDYAVADGNLFLSPKKLLGTSNAKVVKEYQW